MRRTGNGALPESFSHPVFHSFFSPFNPCSQNVAKRSRLHDPDFRLASIAWLNPPVVLPLFTAIPIIREAALNERISELLPRHIQKKSEPATLKCVSSGFLIVNFWFVAEPLQGIDIQLQILKYSAKRHNTVNEVRF